jgi:hypothetical protein
VSAGAGPSRFRGAAAYAALVVAALLVLLSAYAVWIERVALDTRGFTETSAALIEDDRIRAAVTTRAVDELFESVDVEAEIEEQLPEDLQPLSGAAAAGLREASYRLVDRALEQPSLQRAWELAVEEAHRALVRALERDGDGLVSEGGVVTLDLRAIVLEAADRIGIRSQVEDKLPADVGEIEVLRSSELDAAQDAFQVLDALAWLLPLLTVGAFGLALWLARDRRGLVRAAGIALAAAGAVGLVAANVLGDYLTDALASDSETRAAAERAWAIVGELLRHSLRWLVVLGAAVVVAAWTAGPGRRAAALRRSLAPALRRRAWAYPVLALAALVLLTRGPAPDFARVLVVAVLFVLAAVWIELVRAQALREAPDAVVPDWVAEARGRVASWWRTRRVMSPRAPAPPAADLAERLALLADLHVRGELTDEEYAAAKARLLAGGPQPGREGGTAGRMPNSPG